MRHHSPFGAASTALYLLPLLVGALAASCDDGGGEPTTDVVPAADTESSDTAADVAEPDSIGADMDDAGGDDTIAQPDVPKVPSNGMCTQTSECVRGTTCVTNRCLSVIDCLSSIDSPGEGCLVTSSTDSVSTAAECNADADCTNSQHGSNCIRRVCTDQLACMTAAECPPDESCLEETICLP